MSILARDHDTICAISTPPGVGGIAVIRVSGHGALSIARRICPFLPKKPESHRIYYGFAHEYETQTDLDEVLASYFGEGKSFTGEETLEISCHGGTIVSANLLHELIKAGARLANKGEFTYRAFLNRRIDLVQAESILGLIEANSKRSSRLAIRQLKGELSQFVDQLEESIHWVLAHLEANIDFAHEDIESADQKLLIERTREIFAGVDGVLAGYEQGRMVQDGVKVAIVGRPNAGKSSLMNALVGEDKSIVTDIEGTTRDRVEASFIFNGIRLTLVDTAGLRDTEDVIEVMGIERAKQALDEADLVLLVIDLLSEFQGDELQFLEGVDADKVWIFGNKLDCVPDQEKTSRLGSWWQKASVILGQNWSGKKQPKMIVGSALGANGLDELKTELQEFTNSDFAELSAVLANSRHFELFRNLRDSLGRGLKLFESSESPEFIAFELRDALFAIHELIGKQFDDQVLDKVFNEFCLGK